MSGIRGFLRTSLAGDSRHGPRTLARRARAACRLTGALVLGGLVQVAGPVSAEVDEHDPLSHPPGRRVDVGGFELHINCAGDRAPTVVVEAGLAGFSLEWLEVQRRVASDLRVCVYDRAGYGWSDPGPLPRTVDRIAGELDKLLSAAGERPPFILVGHSFGGYVVRYFAAHAPERVAGLVFVDASQPEQHALMPLSLPRGGGRLHATPVLPEGFPEALATTALRLMMKPGARQTQYSELTNFAASAARLGAVSELPMVPVVVLSRSVVGTTGAFDAAARDEQIWSALQVSFASRTPGSSFYEVDGAHHHIHLSHPERVAEAIRGVSMAARFAGDLRAAQYASVP